MAIQTITIDPAVMSLSDDDIVTKINDATTQITRASSVAPAARPIDAGEVDNTALDANAAKDNLDALSDTARGYVKTDPSTGQFPVVSIQRDAAAELEIDYDDVAI